MPNTRDEESGRCSRNCVLIIIGVLVVMILLGMLIVILYGSTITKPTVDDHALSYNGLQNNFQENRSHIILHHSTQDPRTAGKSSKLDIGLVIIIIGILLTILILSSCIIILLWKKQNGKNQSSKCPKNNTSAESLSSQKETLVKQKHFWEEETEPNLEENFEVFKELPKRNKDDDEYEKNKLSRETEKESYKIAKVIMPSSKVPRQSTSRGKHTNEYPIDYKQRTREILSRNESRACKYSNSLDSPTKRGSKKTLKQQFISLFKRKKSGISQNQHAHISSCPSLGTVHSSHSTDIQDTGLNKYTSELLLEQASGGTSQRVKTDLKSTPQLHSSRRSERYQHEQASTSSSFSSVASGHSKTSMLKQAPCDPSSGYDTDVSKINSNNSSVTDIDVSFDRKQTTKHQQPDTKLSIYCRKFESLEDDAPSLIIKLLKRLMSMGDIIENEVQYIHFMHHTVRMMMDAAKKAEEEVLSITCEDFDKCKELHSKCGYKTYMIDSESGFLSIGVEEWDCLNLYKQQRDHVCQRKISENSEFDGSVYIFIDYSGQPLTDQTEIEDTKAVVKVKQEDPLNVLENEMKTSSDDHAEIQDIV